MREYVYGYAMNSFQFYCIFLSTCLYSVSRSLFETSNMPYSLGQEFMQQLSSFNKFGFSLGSQIQKKKKVSSADIRSKQHKKLKKHEHVWKQNLTGAVCMSCSLYQTIPLIFLSYQQAASF